MSALTLLAPLAGWLAPLDEVPDPVFAGRMMGDGVAIDPTGEALFAPCAGTILKVHPARHAVSLRTANGADLLMHLGLDTVALGGEGFEVHVADGQDVAAGERLVSFDLDRLAQRARCLITPVLVTNSDAFHLTILATGREVAVGEPILSLEGRGRFATEASGEGARVARRLRITHAHGLHARPAARLATEARRWTAVSEITFGEGRASTASAVAIMTLGVAGGDEIELSATGADAEAAVEALARVVAAINAERAPVAAPARPPPSAAPAGAIQGVRAAPGLAIGPAWRLVAPDAPVLKVAADEAREAAALAAALAAVRAELEDRRARSAGEAHGVVEAHLVLLDDPGLVDPTRRAIAAGVAAGVAWRDSLAAQAAALQAAADPRQAERAADLRDLQQQVLWALAERRPDAPAPPPGAILIADDLLPSQLAGLGGLAGICTARGGPTSHVAVLAAAMNIPAVVAAGPAVLGLAEGGTVVLDGDAGLLEPAPNAARLKAAAAEIATRAARHAEALAVAAEPCRTADGQRIEVFANLGALADAEAAARNGAEGCGLLRTEFLFLDRIAPPSEDEQAQAYQAIAEALSGRPVIVRTLDVGGDKPAPYLDLPVEENPALGVRGVRVSLRHPDLLRAQLRAILRVRPAGQCRIMVPMVASVSEVQAVRALLDEAARELGYEATPSLGVMIETPAAAATADLIAPHVDFVSIGSNDLAQYALAMDRGNPALAAEVDALHPAVLRLIRLAAEGARRHGRPVGVCGGLASDAAAVPILIGLGATELSVTPARTPATKALIRSLDIAACRELAGRACDQTSAADVRGLQFAPKPARRAQKGAPA
ncbi:MAG: phosphoenolpyruvate--protein phosphotransferase [Phenylobacterium sp.]|nr:MAG: phosphoenolpyruvate--protein phosphotransferase [Phenylobacterium sp.]